MEETHAMSGQSALGPASADAAHAMLVALQRCMAAYGIYSLDHPATQQALLEGAAEWSTLGNRAAQGSGELEIGISAHAFIVGDANLEFSDRLEALGARLSRAGLAGVTIRSGISAPQFRAMVQALVEHRADEADACGLAARVAEASAKHVTLMPLDVRGVRIEDRARVESDAGAVRAGDLTSLVRPLLRPVAEREGAAAPQELANLANQWDEDPERTPAMANHAQIAGAMGNATNASREEIGRSLGAFVASLKPELASAFLRVQPDDPSASMYLYRQLASALPMDRLIAAMAGASADGSPPTIESLRMLQKFVRIAERDSSESCALAGVVEGLIEDGRVSNRWARELGSAMGEILRSRQQNSYTPSEYAQRLDELSSVGVLGRPLREERRLEWETAPVRCALVATALVNDPAQSEDDRRSLLHSVADMLPTLARERQWSAIGAAGEFARTVPSGAPHSDHARRLLDALRTSDYLSPLVDAVLAGREPAEDWVGSFRASGAVGVVELFHAATRVGDARLLAIAGMLLADEKLDVSMIARLALERGEACANAAVRIATTLGAERATRLLAPMLSAQEPATREAAARGISSLPAPWPIDLLEKALADPHEPVRLAALRGMNVGANAEAIPLIADALARGSDAMSLTDEAAAGVEALASRGQEGITALGRVVRDLARRPMPARLAHARRLRWCAARLGAGPALRAKVPFWARAMLVLGRIVFYNDPRFFGGGT